MAAGTLFKNTKNVLSKQKVKQLKKLMKKMKNKYKNLNKKDLDEKIKKFKLLNDKIKKQLFPELNFTYINSIIKDTSTKLQSHIMSKGLKPCKF